MQRCPRCHLEWTPPPLACPRCQPKLSSPPSPHNEETLIELTTRHDLEGVRTKLADIGIVNSVGRDNQTPLHIAAKQGDMAIVQLLLKNGANVASLDAHGQTPLALSINANHLETAQLIYRHGGRMPQRWWIFIILLVIFFLFDILSSTYLDSSYVMLAYVIIFIDQQVYTRWRLHHLQMKAQAIS